MLYCAMLPQQSRAPGRAPAPCVQSGRKHRAHCLACGGAALFFLHLRVTGLEVNGAGAAVQSALPG